VTLTATPSGDDVFTGWGGDCSGRATCTLTMNAAKNVTAEFAAGHRLTLNMSRGDITCVVVLAIQCAPDATITTSPFQYQCGPWPNVLDDHTRTCSWTFPVGSSVTLTAAELTGNPTTWTGCQSISGRACTVTMDANKTVSAAF
jgi:hypothetical protein